MSSHPTIDSGGNKRMISLRAVIAGDVEFVLE